MSIVKDAWIFVTKFFTIVKAWVIETKEEHKFTNVLIPIIAIAVIIASYSGLLFTWAPWRTMALWGIIFWLGQQTQGVISVFKKLKKQNDW